MIHAVLFDLDDTLLDFHKAEARAIRLTLERLGVTPTEETITLYSAINQSQWELLEAGQLTRDQLLLRRFDLLFSRLGIQRSSAETQRIYEKLLAEGHDFIPGAPELLETLYPDYALYLVSNGTAPVQDSRLKSAGISHYFRGIFISQHIGCDKPSAEFFDRCFQRMPGIRREDCLLVGDSLTSDMRGGLNAGIKTCWFNPHRRPRRADIPVDYEIQALMQLPGLLAGLSRVPATV